MSPATAAAQVIIIGAGPVGLTLGIDLAQRGVDVLMLESRPEGARPEPKCNHVAARTMEIFRRLGIVRQVRDTGLPPDYPNDIAYRTSFTGRELSRIRIPARRDRYTATGGPDTGWPTPEPPHRINQIYLEPVLYAAARATPGLRILDHVRFEDFTQDHTGVRVRATDLSTGRALALACDYLVGCDGGRSSVRHQIGAKLSGTDVVARVQSSFIRAPGLYALAAHPPAWATFSFNPRRVGNVYAIDGRETFLLHNYLKADEPDFDSVDRDWAIRTILGVDASFDYEILSREDWFGRRLVADRFRDRRVFICGDAAHLWVPMAGYGMNAGIADAMNLSWCLAARLQGWAGAAMLDAYEAERKPITEQVAQFAMNHALALQKESAGVPEGIEDDSPAGQAARDAAGRSLYELNVQQYCCAGLNFGYYYDSSPVLVHDDEPAPAYTMSRFTASTVPGCRAPHFWLRDGRSLYDALGPGYTLLRLRAGINVQPLVDEAARCGMPLAVLDLPDESQRDAAYRHGLVLVRSDQHVAWRGDRLPDDVRALVDRLRGVQAGA